MRELGILYFVVETVLDIVRYKGLSEVKSIVLEVGAQSPVVPGYLSDCFPAAVSGTILERAELMISVLPAEGWCRACGKKFKAAGRKVACPVCGSADCELLNDPEFNIKEIAAC